MCYFILDFYKVLELLWEFEFCGKASVLTMSSQDEFKRKRTEEKTLWPFFGGCMTTIFKMAALLYRRWMKTFFSEFFKRLVFLEMREVILFFMQIFT